PNNAITAILHIIQDILSETMGTAAAPHTLQDEFSATLGLSGGTTHLTRRISGDFGVRRWHHTPYKMSFQRLWGAAATPRTLLNEFQLTLGRDDSFIR